MAYVKAQGEQVVQFPYSLGKLRQDHQNVSFPRQVPEETLASFGVYAVHKESMPSVDEKTHVAVLSESPVKKPDGWVLQWSVVEKTAEEKQAYYDNAARGVRLERDVLLSKTDWMALSDTPPMPEAWASYRQALRDITDQAGFPYDVTWPEKPSS